MTSLWRSATTDTLLKSSRLAKFKCEIFSACVKFGGNPCREVDTLGFYTHTHTHTHRHTDRHTDRHTYTNEIIYQIYIYKTDKTVNLLQGMILTLQPFRPVLDRRYTGNDKNKETRTL